MKNRKRLIKTQITINQHFNPVIFYYLTVVGVYCNDLKLSFTTND